MQVYTTAKHRLQYAAVIEYVYMIDNKNMSHKCSEMIGVKLLSDNAEDEFLSNPSWIYIIISHIYMNKFAWWKVKQ